MLVSGASAKPARRLQRRRARISERKRRTLAATAPGGLPARTCSKCLRARSFSPLRKNARASSRRTRTRSGRSISIARNEAMASSSSASRSSPERSGCCDAPVAARPMRKSTFASTAPPWASGRRMPSASSNRPCSIRVRGLRDGSHGGLACGRWRRRLLPRAPCRGGEQEGGGGGQGAKERVDRHVCYS